MKYKNATQILPPALLQQIQQYADGELLYIPRLQDNRQCWGAGTNTRQELQHRNACIWQDHLAGADNRTLAKRYYLSVKSIQRILMQQKKANNT